MSFKERLRRLRAEKDLTQTELAKVFGVAPTTIASWEQGRSRPDIEEIALIANYFGVSVDYLLCLTDEKRPNERLYYSIRELKDRGLVVSDSAHDRDVIKFKELMAEEDITPEFLREILPIIRYLKEHLPKTK